MRSDRALQKVAMSMLKESGITVAPVNVHRVAATLGATVQPEFAEDEISGGLHRTSAGPIIGVNASHHPNRQRFTIAHEIGHLVLHEQENFFVDRLFRRDAKSSEAVDPIEIEANKFAAALIMPEDFLRDDIARETLPLTSDAVERLARQYQVSQQAMTFRLDNLGLPMELL